jgi:hypothetical protein
MLPAASQIFTVDGDKTAPTITIDKYDNKTPAKTLTVTASTNEGTLNFSTYTFTTNSSFDFVATDVAGNISTSRVTVTNIVDEDQTVPNEDGEVAISSSTPEVVVSSPTQPLVVTIPSGTINVTINYDSLITGGTGLIPQTTINAGAASIEIPASTITSASTTWNGILSAPQITTVDLPEIPGQIKALSSAIEIGFSGAKLSFDKGVRILMPGQANTRVGYTRTGEAFTEITNICSSDNQSVGDALSVDGDCKINVGSDLVIWTKHFTKFATYTQTTKSNGGGGGGGGGASYCSSVVYGEWGACTNGNQYRSITKASQYCSLSVKQQLDSSRPCVTPATPAVPGVKPATPATPANPITKKVLGEKKYADSTLLKGTNNRIYVVKGDTLEYVSSLKELAKYRGPVLKVSNDVINSFSPVAVLGAKKYANGTLIKAKGDVKIYVIKDGKKVHIRSLAELRKQNGKTLTVEARELNNY